MHGVLVEFVLVVPKDPGSIPSQVSGSFSEYFIPLKFLKSLLTTSKKTIINLKHVNQQKAQ